MKSAVFHPCFGHYRLLDCAEAAQPLAAFSDQVLAHITLAGSVGPAALKPKKPPKRSRSGEHEERDGFTLAFLWDMCCGAEWWK